MKKRIHVLACSFCLTFASLSFAAKDTTSAIKAANQLPKAQALVQAAKFKEAYALLQPLEFDLAGNVQYDFLLGVSALNSGRPDRATIALERLVATNARYGDARQWLGIAYYQSGDMARAKKEFNSLLSQKPSAQINATATQYLNAIKRQEAAKDLAAKKAQLPYLLGNVELGYGHDSSIATVPDNYDPAYLATVGLPNTAPNNPPIPSGISDNFSMLNLNMEGRLPISSAGTYGFLSVDSNNKLYNDHKLLNSHTSLVKGGLNMVSQGNTYRFDVARRGYRQEGTTIGYTNNSSQTSLTGDARFMMTAGDFWAFTLQYNAPRYSTSPNQDTNQTMLGTNYMHIFPRQGSPLVYFALNHSRDRALREFSTSYLTPATPTPTSIAVTTDVRRNTNTVIFYTQYSYIKDADVLGMWMKSYRRDSTAYARAYVVDLPYGRDGMTVMMLGMNWRPTPNWTVHPQWMRIKNDSNIPLYNFQKTEFSLGVKREFK